MRTELLQKTRNALTLEDVLGQIRRRVAHEGSQQAAAHRLCVSPQYLSDILAGRKEPGPAILAALELTPFTLYLPKE